MKQLSEFGTIAMQLTTKRFWKPIGMSGCPLACLCLAGSRKWICDRQVVNHRITQWRLRCLAIFDSVENAEDLARTSTAYPNATLDLLKLPDDGFTDHSGMWDASLRLAYSLLLLNRLRTHLVAKPPAA